MTSQVQAVVFDVGRVLYQWRLSALFDKLITDEAERDWFLANVVTEQWHVQHDAGRPLAEMVPELQTAFPDHAHLVEAYATRFNETIPGPVPGSLELVERLDAAGMPLYAITNFGAEFWAMFRPTAPVFDRFRDIVVSGEEKLAKPDPAIFDLAARRFGHAPEAMLFIDDNAANVAAAAALGWQVHHFADAPALERDLAARGLLA
jgi:2-haloacid dehalogenase